MREPRRRNGLFVCLLALLASHCRGEPAPQAATAGTISASAAPSSAAPASASAAPAPSLAPGPTAAPSAAAVASSVPKPSDHPPPSPPDSDEPSLLAADGTALPQTEERPSTTSERFKRRMQRLADSILSGDAERARSSFFPLVAYAQVKDVQKPERDYRYRLMAHFERDVREYRKALGQAAAHAQFLGVSVAEERVEWMKPGKEGNRLGYFRVLRSRLRFASPGGKEQTFELTSMISWRGEWYVVHLHGFE
jgi:hypothetical protein